jgi:hypothetical protein
VLEGQRPGVGSRRSIGDCRDEGVVYGKYLYDE